MDVTRLSTQSITHGLSVNLRSVDGWAVPVTTELRYSSDDPYAVTLAFFVGETSIVWTFARDLLADGLTEPVGDGDVHVWPCLDEDGNAILSIELCSPDGDALVEVRTTDAVAFVDRMHALVPVGEEADLIDMDAFIDSVRDAEFF